MFTLNSTVNVEGTGKPLPANGSWGAQTQFPTGLPKPCLQAQVPCIKVVYRVPEAKVVCEWTVGVLVAVERQPDGTMKHAVHQVVLDENEAAARYTLRKAWGKGEDMPRQTHFERAMYPEIARMSNVDGLVQVRMIVGPDGLVKSAVALNGPPLLKPPAVEAVQKFKYQPFITGQQPVSFQLDLTFAYNAKKADTFAGMDPGGRVVLQQTDPHFEPGFHMDGASSGSWENCSAVTCVQSAPAVPH